MSDIVEYKGDLKAFVKDTILKYCPYSEDRWDELHRKGSPEMGINLRIHDERSQLIFMYGDSTFKSGVPERNLFEYIISFEEICDIIDTILEDHTHISGISIYSDIIELKFGISWCDETLKGIACGEIELRIEFKNIELKKEYLPKLVKKYYDKIKETHSFIFAKEEYIKDMQKTYFDDLDKAQLIELLNEMDEDELKKLLKCLDFDTFRRHIVNEESEETKNKLLENYVKKAY